MVSTKILQMGFKMGIKREIAAYPSLKDERYFDGFKRSLFIVSKTHECNEVLDPNYTPGSEPEEKELFEAKQTFMFMGKTIVRRHLANTDAQAVWKELSEHMRTSSKGASEKRRLTQYVTNTVLDDSFKGTTEQFVLHFNEQFRQLEEISEDSERLPPTVKLTLLQTAVRSIMILGLLKLWMSSKAPPMDMDPPPPCPMILAMIYLSMHVLGMIRLK